MCVTVCCGLSAALMGLASGVTSMAALWTLQALLQGVGWPTAAKLLLDGVPPADLGHYWGLISVAGNVGQSFAPLAMALLCETLDAGWELIFFAAGGAQTESPQLCSCPLAGANTDWGVRAGVAIALGLAVWFVLRRPEEGRGREPARGAGGEPETEPEPEPGPGPEPESEKGGSRYAVLLNPTIWLMALCNMVVYLPLKACQEWLLVIAVQHFQLSVVVGSSLVAWHEAGGFVGSAFAPAASDWCGGRRALVVAVCCGVAALAFGGLFGLEPAAATDGTRGYVRPLPTLPSRPPCMCVGLRTDSPAAGVL